MCCLAAKETLNTIKQDEENENIVFSHVLTQSLCTLTASCTHTLSIPHHLPTHSGTSTYTPSTCHSFPFSLFLVLLLNHLCSQKSRTPLSCLLTSTGNPWLCHHHGNLGALGSRWRRETGIGFDWLVIVKAWGRKPSWEELGCIECTRQGKKEILSMHVSLAGQCVRKRVEIWACQCHCPAPYDWVLAQVSEHSLSVFSL